MSPNAGAPRGLEGVVAAQTRLSHVDGQNGVLIIGGYTVEDLVEHAGLEGAAHLLWRGRLPDRVEQRDLAAQMAELRQLSPLTLDLLRAAAKAPPIDALRMACATLSLGLSDPNAITPEADFIASMRLTACFPTIVAAHARIAKGQDPIPPRADLPLAANFLYMVHGREVDPAAARALDAYWVTVIDHGMNASTFTARVIASTRSDMVSSVTGALGALKGPLHGGAPGPVLDMLHEIKTTDRAEPWLRNEIAQGRRIMGFGHRVYRVRDPRAEVLSRVAERLGQAQLENRKLYDLARHVEKTAVRVLAENKPGRHLSTNVEFFTALVLQALGLEPTQFVAMFACGRVAGWCAHVIEQHAEDHLIRPQSEYIGPIGMKVED
ncbi:MAG TPA: citrate synthase/methylcitrate synthase [Candidatus Limnocylindrales bacterium]|nr:citrate synthase/methylcitrate synthase [Candidatus Limnocylindrales bacterium]